MLYTLRFLSVLCLICARDFLLTDVLIVVGATTNRSSGITHDELTTMAEKRTTVFPNLWNAKERFFVWMPGFHTNPEGSGAKVLCVGRLSNARKEKMSAVK